MGTGRPSWVRPVALAHAERLLAQKRYASLRHAPLPADLDAVSRFLVGTHEDLTGRQQAAALGVSHSAVHYWRGALARRGLIAPERRAGRPPITDPEAQAAARLWCAGYSHRAIAAMREISASRVPALLARAGVTPETPRTRPALDAARLIVLFGLDRRRADVVRWVAYGWLPDYRAHAASGAAYRWDMDDVVALVRNRESWVGWAPSQITDPQLRALAERERRAARGAWHSQAEIAALLGLDPSTLRRWQHEDGLLVGLPERRWGGARLWWLTESQRAHLAGLSVGHHRRLSYAHRLAAIALRPRLAAAYGRPAPCQAAAD